MSGNLLLWKWSADYDTSAKRKHHKLKFAHIADAFCEKEDHPAIGETAIDVLVTKIEERFGLDTEQRHFIIHRYEKAVLIEFANIDREEVISKTGPLARSLGFNSMEI